MKRVLFILLVLAVSVSAYEDCGGLSGYSCTAYSSGMGSDCHDFCWDGNSLKEITYTSESEQKCWGGSPPCLSSDGYTLTTSTYEGTGRTFTNTDEGYRLGEEAYEFSDEHKELLNSEATRLSVYNDVGSVHARFIEIVPPDSLNTVHEDDSDSTYVRIRAYSVATLDGIDDPANEQIDVKRITGLQSGDPVVEECEIQSGARICGSLLDAQRLNVGGEPVIYESPQRLDATINDGVLTVTSMDFFEATATESVTIANTDTTASDFSGVQNGYNPDQQIVHYGSFTSTTQEVDGIQYITAAGTTACISNCDTAEQFVSGGTTYYQAYSNTDTGVISMHIPPRCTDDKCRMYSDAYTDGNGNLITFITEIDADGNEEFIGSSVVQVGQQTGDGSIQLGSPLDYGLVVCADAAITGQTCTCDNCDQLMAGGEGVPYRYSYKDQYLQRLQTQRQETQAAEQKARNDFLNQEVAESEIIWDVGWGARDFNVAGAFLESIQMAGSTQWLSDLAFGEERSTLITDRYDRFMSNLFNTNYVSSLVCHGQLPDILPGSGIGQVFDSQGNPVSVAGINAQKHGPQPYLCDLESEEVCPEDAECVNMVCEVDDEPLLGYLYVIEWSVRLPYPLMVSSSYADYLGLQVRLDDEKALYQDAYNSEYPIYLEAGAQESDRIITYSVNDYNSVGIYFEQPIKSAMGSGTTAFMARKTGGNGRDLSEVTNTIVEVSSPTTFSYGTEDELPPSTLSSSAGTVTQVQI